MYLAPFFFCLVPLFLFHGPHVPTGSFKEIVLGKYAYVLSCRELDEKIDIFLMLNMKRQPAVS